ncbi:unnamed protein product [Staurois parvus]|uniref:Uncharacterized protein n=1 Tax=Staurois parvus TaxID=386267 RepID=A0ABN9CHU9_9NEOB|nr:unnamed protein product [Staurois parvus]
MPSSAASQCHLSVLIIITHHQCRLSVPPISAAYPCHLINAAYQCCLSVPFSATYQCPSVLPISVASSTHISEGEKLPVCKIL